MPEVENHTGLLVDMDIKNYIGILAQVNSSDDPHWRERAKDICSRNKTRYAAQLYVDGKLLAEIDGTGNYHAYGPPEAVAEAIFAASSNVVINLDPPGTLIGLGKRSK